MRRDVSRCNAESAQNQPVRIMRYAALEEKTRNGILCTPSVNPPRKQRMSFRQRSVTYVKKFSSRFHEGEEVPNVL
jgi:hypothetical protein